MMASEPQSVSFTKQVLELSGLVTGSWLILPKLRLNHQVPWTASQKYPAGNLDQRSIHRNKSEASEMISKSSTPSSMLSMLRYSVTRLQITNPLPSSKGRQQNTEIGMNVSLFNVPPPQKKKNKQIITPTIFKMFKCFIAILNDQ